jgi:predicted dehydrogenase
MLNLALLSYWHVHARDYEREAAAHPGTSITHVWDEDRTRGATEADRIGARFEPNLETLLANESIDGVIVTTATADHPRVIPAAARAGKHIFTEKVIAATTLDAREILDTVREAGVIMVVCLPRLSNGYTRTIKAMIEGGELGRITYGRMRVGHNGAMRTESEPNGWLPDRFYRPGEAQGGALIDLGAHPLYLLRHLLGAPESVTARYGYVTGREVEDQAVVTLGYANGAIGVAEVSFVDQPGSFVVEIRGELAEVSIAQPDMELWLRRALANRRERADREHCPVETDLASPFVQWVEQVTRGERDEDNLALAFDLTRIAEAANQSATLGSTIHLKE